MRLIQSLDIYLPILHKMLNLDMEKLLSKCGKWTHLVLDILLEATDFTDPSGPVLQGNVTGQFYAHNVILVSKNVKGPEHHVIRNPTQAWTN